MSSKNTAVDTASPRVWASLVALGWLIPGAGHIYLKRHYRGILIGSSVVILFVLGLLMRGYMFEPATGDVLTIIIYVGGFIGNLASGLPYVLSKLFGYTQADVAGHVHDYGTKFLVAAGLCNILAMVDVYEIATKKKD